MQSLVREVSDLVGKPYRKGGRGPAFFDCAGMVIEIQARLGRPLSAGDTPESDLAQATSMQRILRTEWLQIDRPEPGAVVFLKPAHVGVILDRQRFIHTTEEYGSALIEALDSPLWRNKIGRYFVPKEI